MYRCHACRANCTQHPYLWGKKISSYQNTYNHAHVCCIAVKHTLLSNIHTCRIHITTRLILYRTPITHGVPTILLSLITVPYKQVTNITIPLQGRCNKLTIYMIMSHVIKIYGANNIKYIDMFVWLTFISYV